MIPQPITNVVLIDGPVDADGRAPRRSALIHHVAYVKGIVSQDTAGIHNPLAQVSAEFRLGHQSVATRGDDDSHFPVAFLADVEDRPDHLAGRGSRVVDGDDERTLGLADKLGQRRRQKRPLKGGPHRCLDVRHSLDFSRG